MAVSASSNLPLTQARRARLITIPMSHYCEKARWALTRAGIAFEEDAHLQVFHYRAVRRYSRNGLVPVLVDGRSVVCESAAILRHIDQQIPTEQQLYPSELDRKIGELEARFDDTLGVETRRWVYYHWLREPAPTVLVTIAQGVPRWERRLAPAMYPLMRRFLKRRLGVTRANVEAGRPRIEGAFDAVAARLEDGRRYLFGDRFTAADLSFACMAAPVLLPPEYGVRLPTLEEAPANARADIRRLRSHPAGQFAQRLFRDHRRLQVDGGST